MKTIELSSRLCLSADTSAAWSAFPEFIPLEGEMIFYTDLKKMKVGDGATKLSELPFTTLTPEEIKDYINDYFLNGEW